jgi:hypothetical protein
LDVTTADFQGDASSSSLPADSRRQAGTPRRRTASGRMIQE